MKYTINDVIRTIPLSTTILLDNFVRMYKLTFPQGREESKYWQSVLLDTLFLAVNNFEQILDVTKRYLDPMSINELKAFLTKGFDAYEVIFTDKYSIDDLLEKLDEVHQIFMMHLDNGLDTDGDIMTEWFLKIAIYVRYAMEKKFPDDLVQGIYHKENAS